MAKAFVPSPSTNGVPSISIFDQSRRQLDRTFEECGPFGIHCRPFVDTFPKPIAPWIASPFISSTDGLAQTNGPLPHVVNAH